MAGAFGIVAAVIKGNTNLRKKSELLMSVRED